MARKDHVTGVEGDDGIWVSGGVVKKLVDVSHGIFVGGNLLCGNGAMRATEMLPTYWNPRRVAALAVISPSLTTPETRLTMGLSSISPK